MLAEAARRLLAAEPLAKNAYLTQGLLLVTVGFISKYSGLQLALILAAESVVLLVTGQQRKNQVLLAGACIAAGLAVGWGMDGMGQFDQPGLWLGLGLGALMLVNTLLAHRHTALAPEPEEALMPPDAALGLLVPGQRQAHSGLVGSRLLHRPGAGGLAGYDLAALPEPSRWCWRRKHSC